MINLPDTLRTLRVKVLISPQSPFVIPHDSGFHLSLEMTSQIRGDGIFYRGKIRDKTATGGMNFCIVSPSQYRGLSFMIWALLAFLLPISSPKSSLLHLQQV
jgi:hypothetical protein